MSNLSRREFAKVAAAGSVSIAALGALARTAAGLAPAPQASASVLAPWGKQVGLELYTVRDLIEKDQAGTLAKVAAIGYKEVEPVGFGGLDPKAYRALLDQNGLTAPSTHTTVSPGPDLEKTLEGYQIIGIKYITAGGPRPAARRPPAPAARGGAGGGTAPRGRGGPGGGQRPPETPETVKRTVDNYNQVGKMAQTYGMQVLVHNHAMEFEKFAGSEQCPYDIILAESDPNLVVMQMDIGWASVAGQDPVAMFHKNPGRFVLWHVKDFMNLQYLFPQPEMTESQRMQVAGNWMVPFGLGGIDYKSIFENAAVAGMKHFCIEQDTAANWGDSVAAAGVSYKNLKKMLS
ncbi:MAG TPA: sugar phosphate isomerase/epimerase [Terriglobales bacterium]